MGQLKLVLPRSGRRRPHATTETPIEVVRRMPMASSFAGTGAWSHDDPRYPAARSELARRPETVELASRAGITIVDTVQAAPILASVVTASRYNADRKRRGLGRRGAVGGPGVQEWERQVFRWVRDGPGFVGAAASMYADWLAANASLVVEERTTDFDEFGRTVWKRTSSAAANHVLSMWRGLDESQADLIKRVIFYGDTVGQCYQVLAKERDRWWYSIISHTAIDLLDNGKVAVRGRPEADAGSIAYREVNDLLVDHLFQSNDPEWSAVPASQMQRVMGEIELLILCHHALGRDLQSRITTNGFAWFMADPPGPGGQTRDWTQEYAQYAAAALDDQETAHEYRPGRTGDIVRAAPMPVQSSKPPVYVPVGRDTTLATTVNELAWNAFCLGIDAPKAAMEGSAESGSRWSGYLARDENSTMAAAPRLQRLCSYVQTSHFDKWWRALGHDGREGRPASDFRVWFDLPQPRPDRTQERLTLAATIPLRPETLADSVGLGPDDVLPPPTGMDDREWAYQWKWGRALATDMAKAETAEAQADLAEDAAEGVTPAEVVDIPNDGSVVSVPKPINADVPPTPVAPGANEAAEPDRPSASEATPLNAAATGPAPYAAEVSGWDDLIPGAR